MMTYGVSAIQEFVLPLALLIHLVGTSVDSRRSGLPLRLVWLEIGNNDVTKCGVEAQARGQERLNPEPMEGLWVRL